MLLVFDEESDRPAAAVYQRVAGNLRERGGDAGSVSARETEDLRDLPRTLAGEEQVVLAPKRHCD